MSKQDRIYRSFARKARLQLVDTRRVDADREQVVGEYGWLMITVKRTKRRIVYYVITNFAPFGCTISNDVANFFDPGKNRLTAGNRDHFMKWKFRSAKVAQHLVTLALLRWSEKNWYVRIQ